MRTPDNPVIRLESVHKSFGKVQALRGLDLTVNRAEIVGLLGDNGAGKSTLIKVLSGLYRPDAGRFFFEGREVDFSRHSVKAARKMGIETVYQDKAVGDRQPLWRNLFVGRHLKGRLGFIDVAKELAVARSVIEELGFTGAGITPHTLAGNLSGGERQGLAIGRAMFFEAKVVVLDEPTTALALGEVEKVLEFTVNVRRKGGSAIMITHSIDHAWEIADRFVLMSHGRLFGEWRKEELTLESLLARMRQACA